MVQAGVLTRDLLGKAQLTYGERNVKYQKCRGTIVSVPVIFITSVCKDSFQITTRYPPSKGRMCIILLEMLT